MHDRKCAKLKRRNVGKSCDNFWKLESLEEERQESYAGKRRRREADTP